MYTKDVGAGLRDKGYNGDTTFFHECIQREVRMMELASTVVNVPKVYWYPGSNNAKPLVPVEECECSEYIDYVPELGCTCSNYDQYIIMQEIDAPTLYSAIVRSKDRTLSHYILNTSMEIEPVLRRVELELSKIHELGLIHGDVNLGNILYDEKEDKIWIIDFECCTSIEEANNTPEEELQEFWYYVSRLLGIE